MPVKNSGASELCLFIEPYGEDYWLEPGEAFTVGLRFPRDAECVDRGSDGSHERNIDHGRPQKVL
ncbi:hypothetical protein ACFYW5_37855, partial [Streptomyces sp. NPDC002779]